MNKPIITVKDLRKVFPATEGRRRAEAFSGVNLTVHEGEFSARRVKGLGLTGPERAVLLAYSKIWLYEELLASVLPDDRWVGTALSRYFPAPLRKRESGPSCA